MLPTIAEAVALCHLSASGSSVATIPSQQPGAPAPARQVKHTGCPWLQSQEVLWQQEHRGATSTDSLSFMRHLNCSIAR